MNTKWLLTKTVSGRITIHWLCLTLAVGGCRRVAEEQPISEAQRNIDAGKAFYEEQVKALEAEKQKLKSEGNSLPNPPSGLADPKNIRKDIVSYEGFVKRFHEATGKDWPTVVAQFTASREKVNAVSIAIPKQEIVNEIVSGLKSVKGQLSPSQKATVVELENLVKQCQTAFANLVSDLDKIKALTAPTFDAVENVVSKVETLKTMSPADAEPVIKAILDTDVPAMLKSIESLAGPELNTLVEAANKLRQDAVTRLEALKAMGGKLTDLAGIIPAIIEQKVNEYVAKGEDVVKSVAEFATALSSMATTSTALAKAFAINPWLGAAVLAILIILAIFSGGSGGDGGTGSAPGSKEGEQKGDKGKGTEVGKGTGRDDQLEGDDTALGSPLDGETTGIGGIGGNVKVAAAWQTRDGRQVMVINLSGLKDAAGQDHSIRGLEISEQADSDESKLIVAQLLEAKAGKRNVNFASGGTYDSNWQKEGFPVVVRMSGFDLDGGKREISLTWESVDAKSQPVIQGL